MAEQLVVTVQDHPEIIVRTVTERGLSAYEIAVRNGFEGTVEEWLTSLGFANHADLAGLAGDDHPQYHNDTRGDLRYYLRDELDTLLGTLLADKSDVGHTHDYSPLGHTHDYAASIHSHAISDVTGLVTALAGLEPALGNPLVDGYVLASTMAGVRSWVALPSGGIGDVTEAGDNVFTGFNTFAGNVELSVGTMLSVANLSVDGTTAFLNTVSFTSPTGQIVSFFNNDFTPSVGQLLGELRFTGYDASTNTQIYSKIQSTILDPVHGSEDSDLLFQTSVGGALATRMTLAQGLVVGAATGGDQGVGSINANAIYVNGVAVGTGGGGVTDHGALTGLADDDHTQYHNDARGDARYYTQGAVDTLLAGKSDVGHTHSYEPLLGNPGTNGHVLASTTGGVRSWVALPTVISDHGGLTGLADDDHTQYYNQARGDARYARLDASNTLLADLTIWSDVDSVNPGPNLNITRRSATPAANDRLGRILFYGDDSANNLTAYAGFEVAIIDPTNASEDARFQFWTTIAGTLAGRAYIGAGLFMTGATSGDMGAGSINATNLYQNGKAALVHAGSYTSGQVTYSASAPSGGADGDLWFKV